MRLIPIFLLFLYAQVFSASKILAINYSFTYKCPNYITYVIDSDTVNWPRLKSFHSEFRSARSIEYIGSGYDKGHMLSAESADDDSVMLYRSFGMYNIAPQLHSFNAGVWLRLENIERQMSLDGDSCIVTSGCLLPGKKSWRGISVPDTFYKVIEAWMAGSSKRYYWIFDQFKGGDVISNEVDSVLFFKNINIKPEQILH